MKHPFTASSRTAGFTLIEIAIVLVIVGMLAGGGTSLLGMLTVRKARNESIEYLNACRETLISYASLYGRLPLASADADGTISDGDGASSGFFPYLDLKMMPTDSYKRVLRYAANSNLGTDRAASCTAIRATLSGAPGVVDADGSTSSFSVAAVLVSAGPADADSDGNVLDLIASGSHQGDNTDGTPNYLRHPPNDTFDDLAVYIGDHEIYDRICEYLVLAVNNNSGSTVHVYDQTEGSDLGSIPSGGLPGRYDILSGTRIEIRSAAGGGGMIVSSTPPTPTLLAGKGHTIDIPP